MANSYEVIPIRAITPPFRRIPFLFRLQWPRLTLCTLLRIGADVGSIWLAFIFSWAAVHNWDGAKIFTASAVPLLQLIAFSTLVLLSVYTTAGIYAGARSLAPSKKLSRIVSAHLFFVLISGTALYISGYADAVALKLLLATALGSTVLHCLSRVASGMLRLEASSDAVDGSHESDNSDKVLVIGGAGYIGSALVEKLLNQGFKVYVLDAMHFGENALSRFAGHPNLTVTCEDFRHIEVITRAMDGMGSVIHLGELVGDPACAVDADLTVDINVTATKLIGEIAKAQGVRRFIFASSCSVYGACDEIVNENSRFNPQSLYARSKVASEAILGALNDEDFSVTCLRFSTIYGISGRTRFDLVVNLLCAKGVRDKIITVFGEDQWRPFVHVEDVASAITLALTAPIEVVAGEAFNVGSDEQNYTLGDVARLILLQVPEACIISDPNCPDRRNYRVSFQKIRSKLGFTPEWDLESGIAQIIASVRSNEIGHYSLPTYSNVLLLKERGPESFATFNITGWENTLMSLDHLAPSKAVLDTAAA